MGRVAGLLPALVAVAPGVLVAQPPLIRVAPAAQPPPSIRVALADPAPAARVSSSRPFALRSGALEIEVIEALIAREAIPGGEAVLALGSFATEAAAREAVRRQAGGPDPGAAARVTRDAATGRFLAVVEGEPAPGAVEELRARGYPGAGRFDLAAAGDALVVRPLGGAPIRIAGDAPLVAHPPPGAFLEWDGAPYRGRLEFSSAGAGVLVVNELALEDYLLGVVPRELPPDLFPELEAIKAQALAARTYASTPRPAYRGRGYDLCSGPACQVYGGVAAERPLSTRAVRETAGEVILYEGRLIDALYTAACGGSTENAENVFSTPTPYLVARACLREAGGARLQAGRALPLEAGIASLTGALPDRWIEDLPRLDATREEAAAVVGGALEWMGFPRCDATGAAGGRLTLGAFAGLVEALRCGRRSASGFDLPGSSPVGRLIAEGLLAPVERGLGAERAVSALEVAGAAAALLRLDAGLLRRAQVRRASAGEILVEPEDDPAGRLLRLEPAAGGLLYREQRPVRIPGRPAPAPVATPVTELRLRPGDFVRYHPSSGSAARPEDAVVRADLLILEDLGEALDRFSGQASWLAPKNSVDLSRRIERLEGRAIGEIVALEPLAYGPSGRVTRLLVRGVRGEVEIERFSIRSRLGLNENLFFAEPRRDGTGRIVEWWFHGRGWGHGLGLCQAGAYGMAAAGSTYREILAHYYAGATIGRR